MKSVAALLALFLASFAPLSAQDLLAVNGIGSDGYIGSYEINGEHFWWLCVEPEGTLSANAGASFIANRLSLTAGWTNQNTERAAYYADPANQDARDALNKQVAIMGYVLDNYLPIAQLMTPGAVTLDDANPSYYSSNENFYNSLNAVQQFLAETYGKPEHVDFTNLTQDYIDRWSNDLSAAGIARSQIFQSILADIEDKDADGDFDNGYTPLYSYYIANSFYSLANNTNPQAGDFNWQDALVIAIPVPEPSGAMMIACCGLAVLMRRWRKLG